MATMFVSKMQAVVDYFGGEEKIVTVMSYALIGQSLMLLLLLQVVTAPYGRYSRKGFGFEINAKLAWTLQELPSFVVPLMLLVCCSSPQIQHLPNKIILGMFLIHYFQRTFIFSLLIRGGKGTPVVTFLMAFVFCMMNGYLQSRHLFLYTDFGPNWSTKPSFYIGIALFFFGMFINIHSDSILRNLRKPDENGYKIPRGGMFEYVSGANFLGEIVEWGGFAIASWTLPALAFALMTFCNIGPRALTHHRARPVSLTWKMERLQNTGYLPPSLWYKQKFEDYPKSRKALIPFLL